MVRLFLSGLIAGLAAIFSGTAAFAATVTGNLTVTLTIVGGCGVVTTTPVNFGTQSYINATLTAQGSVQVICSLNLPYTVGLNGGQSGNINGRQMLNGANPVTYQLYQDSGHTNVWGNSAGSYYSGTGSGLAQIIPVYGQILPPQAVVAGVYTDTVTVSLNY